MITYYRGILYNGNRHIDKLCFVYTGKSNRDYRTIKIKIDGEIKTLCLDSTDDFDKLLPLLKEDSEQVLTDKLEVLDVWVWWFPNSFNEPKLVETTIEDDRRYLLNGKQINFFYSTRKEAITAAIRQYSERIYFYRRKLDNAMALTIDTI